MHAYAYLCVFYVFLDVILYNFDVFPEILFQVVLVVDLLDRPRESLIELIDQVLPLDTSKYILMHIGY